MSLQLSFFKVFALRTKFFLKKHVLTLVNLQILIIVGIRQGE